MAVQRPISLRRLAPVAAIGLFLLACTGARAAESKDDLLSTFKEVYDRVRAFYVEPVEGDKVIASAVSGMLTGLDADSGYVEAASLGKRTPDLPGEIPEFGLVVTVVDNFVQVIAPLEGGPAAKAGLKPRDRIVGLANEPIYGLSLDDSLERLKGQPGTTAKLNVQRGVSELLTLDVTRETPKPVAVTARLDSDVAVLRIARFTDHTAAEVASALDGFKKQHGVALQGVVIDLRNNPGGPVEQGVKTANLFLHSGLIATAKGRSAKDAKEYKAESGATAANLPIVAVVNGGSAGASEILAGALQDRHRGVVIGTKSYGKASVQKIVPLANGGGLRLTVAHFFTPSGGQIDGHGITPDIDVPAAQLDVIAQPRLLSESNLRGALSNPNKPAATAAAAPAAKPDEKAAPAPTTDYQISRAVDLIHGIALYTASAQKTE
jgi:carboxyl-terminal processing protease